MSRYIIFFVVLFIIFEERVSASSVCYHLWYFSSASKSCTVISCTAGPGLNPNYTIESSCPMDDGSTSQRTSQVVIPPSEISSLINCKGYLAVKVCPRTINLESAVTHCVTQWYTSSKAENCTYNGARIVSKGVCEIRALCEIVNDGVSTYSSETSMFILDTSLLKDCTTYQSVETCYASRCLQQWYKLNLDRYSCEVSGYELQADGRCKISTSCNPPEKRPFYTRFYYKCSENKCGFLKKSLE